jgi:hypothetical protein
MADDPLIPIQMGDTFVMGLGGHLWIVLSDPAKNCGNFIMANLTSDRRRAGTDCEVNVGEHKWVTHKCFVNFGDAKEVTPQQAAELQKFIRGGVIEKHFPMEQSILQRITAAAKISKALPIAFKKHF